MIFTRTASGALYAQADKSDIGSLKFEDMSVGMVVWTGKDGRITSHQIRSVRRARGCGSGVLVSVTPAIRLGTIETEYDLGWFENTKEKATQTFSWNLKGGVRCR